MERCSVTVLTEANSLMHAPETERVFYAKDVPSPSLDNRLFPHYFLKFIYEIYDGHEISLISKVKLFFYILNPTNSTTTTILNPPKLHSWKHLERLLHI